MQLNARNGRAGGRQQAKRDIDADQIDTNMHATPGQNAALRERMVPGPGGKPPPSGGRSLQR
jgi:hypothetical protein